METVASLLLAAFGIAAFIVLLKRSRRSPSPVESFNLMAEEAMRIRSRVELALRLGVAIGLAAALVAVISLRRDGELLPPTDVIYPAVAIGGALCGAALWFWFLRHEKSK